MGWKPREVELETRGAFMASWNAWRRANTVPSGPRPPTPEQHEAAVAYARSLG